MKLIDWKACFIQTKKIQEIKLKWFQIRQRILVTNIVLKEMGITQSVLCDFCNRERDVFQHCMWKCEHVKSFWNELKKKKPKKPSSYVKTVNISVTSYLMKKIFCLVLTLISKVTIFLILLYFLRFFFFLSMVADMNKINQD